MGDAAPVVERLDVAAYRIPLPEPESDGTLDWSATDVVVVTATSGTTVGLGYTYAPAAAAAVVADTLRDVVVGGEVAATGRTWSAMVRAIRNQGRPGVAGCAVSATDVALWDLHAKVREVPLPALLGRWRDEVAGYGSGGFTSMATGDLCAQLAGWAEAGLGAVKMKVGRHAAADRERVAAARRAVGPEVSLFVDANGAWSRQQALGMAQAFADHGVTWFEEPVSSDDLEGLHLLRDQSPPGMEVTAGEYGYHLPYFRRMLAAGSVDCLQADVTRCGGITAFVRVGALAAAHGIDLSSHTAPHVSAHACTGIARARHVECFADHLRAEELLFDGALQPSKGVLRPDLDRLGLGIELRQPTAAQYER